jgi:hypothetical protein
VLHDPRRHLLQLSIGVVSSRDDQRREFEPDVRLLREILERLEHRLQVSLGELPIETLGKGLQINIGSIHVVVEVPAWLVADISSRHCHRLDISFVTSLRDVDRVLVEDDGIVVRERHAGATEPFGCRSKVLRRGRVRQRVGLPRLTNVPILAELARQVAPRRPEREYRSAGVKVVQRLLLDRIHAESTGATVGGEHDRVVLAHPDKAHPALPLPQMAVAGAQVALDAPVVEFVPVFGRNDR